MRILPPWTLYILTLLSGGLFMYVWLHLLMTQVNELEQRAVFPARAISAAMAIGLTAYLGNIAMILTPHGYFAPLTGLGSPLGLAPFVLIVLVDRHVRQASGQALSFSTAVATFLLTLDYLISYPLVQQRLNDLIVARRSEVLS